MDTIKMRQTLFRITLVKGIIFILLSIVHIVYSFTIEYGEIKGKMPEELERFYILWFNVTGLYFLFIGTVELYLLRLIRQGFQEARHLAIVIASFTIFTGLCGLTGFRLAPSPPYLIFILGIVYIIPLLRSAGAFSVQGKEMSLTKN